MLTDKCIYLDIDNKTCVLCKNAGFDLDTCSKTSMCIANSKNECNMFEKDLNQHKHQEVHHVHR